jgi:hypothetical protein
MPTPELLQVAPLQSPTERLVQTVTVYIGNGDRVVITTESGTFTVTGSFDAALNPALVEVSLLPNRTHHLEVNAHVRRIVHPSGCISGDYTLTTRTDANGRPLVIEQGPRRIFLPFLVVAVRPAR